MLKVLHITSNDAKTGGAIAVARLHEALLKAGHHSHILTFADVPVGKTISRVDRSFFWRGVDAVTRRVTDLIALPYLFRFSTPAIWSAIDKIKPDLIHLHWTYSFGIPISMLPALTRRYPLVWTFHDMWAMTGGCTNSMGCERWQSGCGNCPQWNGGLEVSSMHPLRRDSTKDAWLIKQWFFAQAEFAVICPSRWMMDEVQSSPLLKNKPTYHIPNCIDTTFWKPLDKDKCKLALDIPADKYVVLFIGKPSNVFAYPGRRGILVQTLDELARSNIELSRRIVILLIGEGGQDFVHQPYQTISVRTVTSPAMLRICYSAADVLLNPTQFDNFPGVIQEAFACGTPTVASDVGGVPDLVRHMCSGYLARPTQPREFAEGIQRILFKPDLARQLGQSARHIAVEEYDEGTIANQIADAYKNEIVRRNA